MPKPARLKPVWRTDFGSQKQSPRTTFGSPKLSYPAKIGPMPKTCPGQKALILAVKLGAPDDLWQLYI